MVAYVLRHNEHFLIDPKDPVWQHYQLFKWWLLPHGLAGATVSTRSARMGDGLSTYSDGIVSACNEGARRRGVEEGQRARQAAELLLRGEP